MSRTAPATDRDALTRWWLGQDSRAPFVTCGQDDLWEILLSAEQQRAAMVNLRRELRGGCDQ
jgi:hypothetical protein